MLAASAWAVVVPASAPPARAVAQPAVGAVSVRAHHADALRPGPTGKAAPGRASWYPRSGMCGASTRLAKGTLATVTDRANGRSVTVINDDRGSAGVHARIIDLCETAFAQLAPLDQGVVAVDVGW